MSNSGENQRKVAEFLLRIKAIKLSPDKPFTWASGRKSPIYCDNRRILSYPTIRTFVRQTATEQIEDRYGRPEAIAGVATGGIALGALIAQELGVPFIYVRASAKEHGTGQLIEGDFTGFSSVFVIEDLISTGGSSLKAVAALKETGATVLGMAAIFTYNFQLSYNNFKDANCELITLSDYDALVKQAVSSGYITENDVELIKTWRFDPASWTPSL